jgi:hypothetical protein
MNRWGWLAVGLMAVGCGADDSGGTKPLPLTTCGWQCAEVADTCQCGRLYYTDTAECGPFFSTAPDGLTPQCSAHPCCIRTLAYESVTPDGRPIEGEGCDCNSYATNVCETILAEKNTPAEIVASCP